METELYSRKKILQRKDSFFGRAMIAMLSLFVLIFCSFESKGQVILQFENNAGDGVYIGGGTGAGTVGAVYEWPNVGSEGGITIKSTIEITDIYGGATLTTIDGSSSEPDWEPQISGPNTTDGNFWGMKFLVSFFDAGDDSPYNLTSFIVQSIDIDGGGGGSALREFTTFDTPFSYQTEDPTELTVTELPGEVEFLSSANLYSGISITATEFIASCTYQNVNSINVTCGVKAVGGSCSGNRLHSLNFRNVVVFDDPEIVVLPIELINFNVVFQGDHSDIFWSTTSEKNNAFFTIERAFENLQFYEIASINGVGTSNQQNDYSFEDFTVHDGFTYYRLKQTDLDGKFSYSDIVSIENSPNESEVLMICNLLGQTVCEYYTGFVLVVYKNGTTQKRYQLNGVLQ